MNLKTLEKSPPIADIDYGTVIDHIPAGYGLKIIQLLHLLKQESPLFVGFNLPSEKMTLKDLIKIKGVKISPLHADYITALAPHATISMICDHHVEKKLAVPVPDVIEKIFQCSNPLCITKETLCSVFIVQKNCKHPELKCKYCEQIYSPENIVLKYDSLY